MSLAEEDRTGLVLWSSKFNIPKKRADWRTGHRHNVNRGKTGHVDEAIYQMDKPNSLTQLVKKMRIMKKKDQAR
jgi:hypothetical protein